MIERLRCEAAVPPGYPHSPCVRPFKHDGQHSATPLWADLFGLDPNFDGRQDRDGLADKLAATYASGLPEEVADRAFALAWEHGHASGAGEVETFYVDFIDLATTAFHAPRASAWAEGYQTCCGDFDIAASREARSPNPHVVFPPASEAGEPA